MQPATLCFIRDQDQILLIKKKRGVGDGLYNGPGGKVEDDETIRAAAIREVEEETGVTPLNVEKIGENKFFFGDDPFMHVHIFIATDYEGELTETAEADPEWFHINDIPYEQMWPDDKHWVPLMLDGQPFDGTFYFDADGNEIRDYTIEPLN